MKKYDLVIFDLDGTLMDTSDGIVDCHNKVAKIFGKAPIEKEEYIEKGIIGYPLPKGFKDHYDMTDEQVAEAVKMYKEVYGKEGVQGATLYEGIPELLKKLKESETKVAVATLKFETIAKEMLKDNGVADYFDVIYGADPNASYQKSDLVNKAIEALRVEKQNTVLIGDSVFDAIGAEKSGVDFIGVSYGKLGGFETNEQVQEVYHTACASSIDELSSVLDKTISK